MTEQEVIQNEQTRIILSIGRIATLLTFVFLYNAYFPKLDTRFGSFLTMLVDFWAVMVSVGLTFYLMTAALSYKTIGKNQISFGDTYISPKLSYYFYDFSKQGQVLNVEFGMLLHSRLRRRFAPRNDKTRG